ncbi:MAG: hypothetical protein ACC608_00540 [Anaerofustis sp.]
MTKVFEDYFSELQADMVDICLEYVEDKATKIYIYCSDEEGFISSNFFYLINGNIFKKHKINDAIDSGSFRYDTSSERQSAVLNIINEDIMKIQDLCQEYKREMPTEMKLEYDVNKNSLNAQYRYDLVYSNDPEKTDDDMANEWFEELKSQM